MKTQIAAMSTAPAVIPPRRPQWWRLGAGALLSAALLAGGLGAGANPAAADDLAPSPQVFVPVSCETTFGQTGDGSFRETTVCDNERLLRDILDLCKRMPRLTICDARN
jgi:hypothetical protein